MKYIREIAFCMVAFLTTVVPHAFSQQYTILHQFNGASDGGGLFGSLIFDQAGNLYGTAMDGGTPTYGFGTAFRLSPNSNGTWTETVLQDFREAINYSKADGLNPEAGLISDGAGNLYGTTFYGGEPSDRGLVFELMPSSNGKWTEKILHVFNNEDGRYPSASLIFDAKGNLYGTTFGVPYQCGTVFKLSPGTSGQWSETVLYDFGPSNGGTRGCESTSNLVFDSVGNLYGTTSGAYSNNIPYGNVFRLTPQHSGPWKLTVLHQFGPGPADGNLPYSGVVFDKAGNLYGTTFGGGSESCAPLGCGVVYRLSPGANGQWTETFLHRFNGSDGENPLGAVVFDAVGNLYGTTDYGGNQNCMMGCGVIYKLTPNKNGSWTQTVEHYFDGLDGWGGGSSLIFDKAGNIYGTTITGGSETDVNFCCGIAFELKP